MSLIFEERLSDSSFVERIWHTQSERMDSFISIAASRLDLVFWKQDGKAYVNLQGPETKAAPAPVPEDAEFFGIVFRHGVYMPHILVSEIVDGDAALPVTTSRSFWLQGAAW